MKKNVKYLGAAAAALLAVAPVVSTGVANAQTVVGGNFGTTVSPSATTQDGKSKATAFKANINGIVNPSNATSIKDITSEAAVKNAIKFTGTQVAGASIVGFGNKTIVSDQANGGTEQTSLVAGHMYWVQTTIAIGGLQKGAWYNFNGEAYQANNNGVVANVPVSYNFTAQSADAIGNPYFTFKNTNVANNDFVNNKFAIPANVNQIKNVWNGSSQSTITANYETESGAIKPALITTTDAQIKEQLANQGVSVASNGAISGKAQSFYVTLTAVNPANNTLAASIKLQFVRDENSALAPMIRYNFGTTDKPNYQYVQQGNRNFRQIPALAFTVNSKEAKAFADNPAANFYATTVADSHSGRVDMHTLGNKVDASTVGVYPVTVYATNANGYKTTYSFNVTILPAAPSNTRTAVVNYVPGYGVNIWNVLSSTSVAFTGVRQPAGSTVTIYGEKTANGQKYYQINKAGTQFILAKYLDGSWEASKPATKPATSTSKEEKMSGVVRVTYNGRGKVRLLTGNGKYTNQYIGKNTSWKVFAKKTINGQTMYRLGNDSQWVPAKFVEFR